ncbi:MAG: hypothetical protein V4709_08810 [Pseudomonadota bacterium]|jgi:hypothetical protein
MAVPDAALEALLKEVLRNFEPGAKQKNAAQRSQLHLRSLLNTGQFESRILDSYLSGSYARNTALHPLNDVDIIFVIDPAAWPRPLFSSFPSPQAVLKSFERCIRYRYTTSALRVQRRSICLQLWHLNIDIVPGIREGLNSHVILIPDRERDEWIRTAPRLHSEAATEMNAKRGKRFKPLVKLLKLWNSNLPKNARFKSFTIETMATRIFRSTDFQSLTDGLLLFWDFMASRYGAGVVRSWPDGFGMSFGRWSVDVPDAVGLKGNTAQSVDNHRAILFSQKARVSRDHLLRALRARTTGAMQESALKAMRFAP